MNNSNILLEEISKRTVSQMVYQRTRFRVERLMADNCSSHNVYTIPGVGFVAYCVDVIVRNSNDYEAVFAEDLEFCDLADILLGV